MARKTISTQPANGKRLKPAKVSTRMKRFAPHLPYEDFKLFPIIDKKTGAGRWAKKIRGKLAYFGSLADGWEAAIEKYQAGVDYLHRGLTPPTDPKGLAAKSLCDQFYHAKQQRHEAGEISARSLDDYDRTCKGIVDAFGRGRLVTDLAAKDFAAFRSQLAKTRGPGSLGNEINRVRMVFKFGFDNGLIDRPMRYGSEFKRPSRKTMRLARADKAPRMLEAAEVRTLIDAADVQLRAMILLGVNAGMGNTDISTLNRGHVDLENGIIDFARPKTGISRRCALWPETVEAIKAALADRYEPVAADDIDAVFVTKYKCRWVRGKGCDAVTGQFSKLLRATGLKANGKRVGVSFYTLRHVFRTVADEVQDRPAIDLCMGHERDDIANHYRERIADERLKAVADHVHAWLYGGDKTPATTPGTKPTSKGGKVKPTPASNEGPRLRLVG